MEIEHHPIHRLAESAHLHAQILHERLNSGLPVPKFTCGAFQDAEAVAERTLHPVDAVLNRELQISDRSSERLEFVHDELQLGIHGTSSLAEASKVVVGNLVWLQIKVSDTNMFALPDPRRLGDRTGRTEKKEMEEAGREQRTDSEFSLVL